MFICTMYIFLYNLYLQKLCIGSCFVLLIFLRYICRSFEIEVVVIYFSKIKWKKKGLEKIKCLFYKKFIRAKLRQCSYTLFSYKCHISLYFLYFIQVVCYLWWRNFIMLIPFLLFYFISSHNLFFHTSLIVSFHYTL